MQPCCTVLGMRIADAASLRLASFIWGRCDDYQALQLQLIGPTAARERDHETNGSVSTFTGHTKLHYYFVACTRA